MNPSIEHLSTSQLPMLFATFAVAVGLVGGSAAVVALRATSRERKAIRDSNIALAPSEAWNGAQGTSEVELSAWLRGRKIDPNSGIADVIRVCWSAWLGSRAATLTEIHVLVARRERSTLAAKLSGGIAALLLVIGIVGTLWSVHPVLKAFQFKVSAPTGAIPQNDDPTLVNVADSTELVNALMNNLGDAFIPSLAALICTIAVVALRGLYSLELHRYTLDLDRFAMGTVMPQYRPRSISEEFKEVRTTFGALANVIREREEKFDEVTVQLSQFVHSIGPTMNYLDTAIGKLSTAADSLSSRANSIATTLTRTLGKKSPLYAAVNGFEDIFTRTNEEMDRLNGLIAVTTKGQEEARQTMLAALDQLAKAVDSIGDAHKKDRQAVASTISEIKSLVSKLPIEVTDSTHDLVRSGLEKIGSSFEIFLKDEKEEVVTTQRDLRNKSSEALETVRKILTETAGKIVESTKAIPEVLDRLDESVKKQSEMELVATAAIRSVAEEAKETLNRIGNPPPVLPQVPPHIAARASGPPPIASPAEAEKSQSVRRSWWPTSGNKF